MESGPEGTWELEHGRRHEDTTRGEVGCPGEGTMGARVQDSTEHNRARPGICQNMGWLFWGTKEQEKQGVR